MPALEAQMIFLLQGKPSGRKRSCRSGVWRRLTTAPIVRMQRFQLLHGRRDMTTGCWDAFSKALPRPFPLDQLCSSAVEVHIRVDDKDRSLVTRIRRALDAILTTYNACSPSTGGRN
eukprot:s381_g34.t1